MVFQKSPRKNKFPGTRAQAMVEFAIALPVLLVLLIGIMEVGRMLVMYALVNNASRDAVRYASSYGIESSGAQYARYKYCAGIKSRATNSAYFVPLSTITISYDSGPGTTSLGSCTATSGEQNITIATGSRVTVTVTATYKPVVKLIPISQRTFTATSSRTIIGIVSLQN